MLTRKSALFLLAIFAFAATQARADEWRHSWTVSSSPEFEFRSSDAGIDITARPGNTIEAYVETKGRRHIGDNDVRIIQRQEGDRVELELQLARRNFIVFGYYTINVVVTVPPNTKLHINTSDGHVHVDGIKGESRLETGDGSVEATHFDGTLWAHTSDGHINAEGRFDRLDLSTGDGHIDLNVDPGSKLASTWEIHTHDGSVRATIPADLAADMDIDTGDGHIDSDIPITVQGGLSRNHLRGTMNGGGPLFRLHTGDGSIHLQRG